jgi:hypothetical protein
VRAELGGFLENRPSPVNGKRRKIHEQKQLLKNKVQ